MPWKRVSDGPNGPPTLSGVVSPDVPGDHHALPFVRAAGNPED
jgi:hypothetical protein